MAARGGDRAAQNDLGMYLQGWGAARNEEDAIAWLLRAYRQGSPTAKATLGTLGVMTN